MDGATSLTPGLRGDMNRQARCDQRWTARPSSWGSREQDQNPTRQGAKGAAKGGTPWKSREGNQFGKGNKKGNWTWESVEQIPASSEWLDGKRPKRVWGPALSQEKRQTLNEEPPVTRPPLPPKRSWLRDLPAKGPLPQHVVYIGRSHGAFYQPQGWWNRFKPDPRKGKQGLQEVLDAYEQHLSQSQILVDRLPELVENEKLSLIGVGFEIKDLVEMDLHCVASVLSTVPMATLDHLGGGRRSEVHSPSAATCVTF